MVDVTLTPKGKTDTEEYRVFFSEKGKEISPWHDIPLKADGDFYNYVCEIPKFTKAKMEIATKEKLNPIAQDIKKGALRFYHGPIFWNYGYLPQTWEDPNIKHPELSVMGDGDPVDVVEIGSTKHKQGDVKQVRALGALAMIDDGELDWKVIAISKEDPLADKLHDIADVEKHCPGVVSGIREWFRWYKTPDDKPINEFGFGERAVDAKQTKEIISECNGHWKDLLSGKAEAGKMWKP
jgi:inorganic pyrophosphatase